MQHLQRGSDKVRRDAIEMGIRKALEGCVACSQGYFALARQHGASDAEIEQRIATAANNIENRISRRDFMKLAAATAVGVALAETGVRTPSAEAAAAYNTSYGVYTCYGTDSGSATVAGVPQNFYIGRFGQGVTPDLRYFNTLAASAAGFNRTYEFWGIVGPRDSYNTPQLAYNWGYSQGAQAAYQWGNSPDQAYVGGHTIFGDIEVAMGGYTGTQPPAAGGKWDVEFQWLINGFLDGVTHYYPTINITPGIYTSFVQWQTYVDTDPLFPFSPSQNFVLWLTGCQTCIVNPCGNGSSTMTQVDNLAPKMIGNILGGCLPVILQYWISGCSPCYGDFDVAIQDPGGGFSPCPSVEPNQNLCGCPPWDVNHDHVVDILDTALIGNYWGQTGSPGWRREDVNRDSMIDILDSSLVGNHWGQTW